MCLCATVLWFLFTTISGYYYFGWFPLATLSGFFLALFFVQPLFELLQVLVLHQLKNISWRLEVNPDSVLVFKFEIVGLVSNVDVRMIRWITFFVLLAPMLYILSFVKGPLLIFTLMTQLFWLCASSDDFRKL